MTGVERRYTGNIGLNFREFARLIRKFTDRLHGLGYPELEW